MTDAPAAIMATLKAETAAWQRRDIAALAEHWVQAPESRLITTFAGFGTLVVEGWEAIHARYRSLATRAPEPHAPLVDLRWDRLNMVVAGDMALGKLRPRLRPGRRR